MLHALLVFFVAYSEILIVFALIAFLVCRWFLAPGDRERTEWALAASALAVPATMLAGGIAISLSRIRPLKYDLYVYSISSLFGGPSFVAGRLAERHLWLHDLIGVSYGLLSVMMVVTFCAHVYLGSKEDTIRVTKTFLLNLIAAVPLYLLFPVCGPEFAFGSFPADPGEIVPHPVLIHAAPNGIPSVHTSTALLVMFFLWRWRWGKIVGIAFLLLTVLATLGSGQHYAVDLVCAVPYAWAVWVVSMRSPGGRSQGAMVTLELGRVLKARARTTEVNLLGLFS